MANPDFRFYPHSASSASSQGGMINSYVAKMKKARKKDAGWAKGLTNDLFH